jgi:hypothetical protein
MDNIGYPTKLPYPYSKRTCILLMNNGLLLDPVAHTYQNLYPDNYQRYQRAVIVV